MTAVMPNSFVHDRLLTPSPKKADVGRRDRAHDLLVERDLVSHNGQYMYEMEERMAPVVDLIDQQPELRWFMRPYLMDFLIEIHQQHRMRPETLYLAVNIVDRYVSKRIVYKKHYQLVGCAALWIASKFEDAKDRVPTVGELRQMCCGAYDESAFIQMEGHVLSTIGWVVGRVSCEYWLRLFCVTSPIEGRREPLDIQNIARFIMEITLFHKEYVPHRPSDIAIGALLLARRIALCPYQKLNETPTAVHIANLLDNELAERRSRLSQIIRKKYASDYLSQASHRVLVFYDQGCRLAYDEWVLVASVSQPPQPVLLYSTPANARKSSGVSPFSETSDFSYEGPETPLTPLPVYDPAKYSVKMDDERIDHV